MADIEVRFVNACEKFGIRELNDYHREAITQFVNNTGIAQETVRKGISYSVEQTLVRGNKSPQDVCKGG